jgi:hypothetical protein
VTDSTRDEARKDGENGGRGERGREKESGREAVRWEVLQTTKQQADAVSVDWLFETVYNSASEHQKKNSSIVSRSITC